MVINGENIGIVTYFTTPSQNSSGKTEKKLKTSVSPAEIPTEYKPRSSPVMMEVQTGDVVGTRKLFWCLGGIQTVFVPDNV
jgi:hypothetical protein